MASTGTRSHVVRFRRYVRSGWTGLFIASIIFVAACSATTYSPPQATSNSKLSAPSLTMAREIFGKTFRHTDVIRPEYADPDSVDDCTIPNNLGTCVVQGENSPQNLFYSTEPSGATFTFTGPGVIDGVSQVPNTFTTSTAPYDYYFTLQAASNAPIGNAYTSTTRITVTAPQSYCQNNFCGTYTISPDFQVSCSVPLNTCPAIQIKDADLNKIVSGSPAPMTSAVVGDQQNVSYSHISGTGAAASYSTGAGTWVIGGNPIKSYPIGIASAPATSPTTAALAAIDLNKISVTPFFWMSPGTNIVSVTGQLTGNLGSNGSEVAYPQANADYVVAAPTNVSIKASSVAGPQSIVSPPTVSLQLGNYPNLPAGIVFNFSATVPSGDMRAENFVG